MKVTSSAFGHNEQIPSKYTCDGEGVSPPLHIEDIPQGTITLVLLHDDPDAPNGTWDHWREYNIPLTNDIAENAGKIGSSGTNGWGKTGYGGPCPPSGSHRYFFKVFALDVELDLAEGSTKSEIEQAMEGHIVAKGELIGLYARK